MKVTFLTNRASFICILLLLISTSFVQSQITTGGDIPDIENLSNDELKSYWEKAQAQGYTVEQLKALALARGVSPSEIAALEGRINSLGTSTSTLSGENIDNSLAVKSGNPPGLTGNEIKPGVKKDSVFGYDFFNNQNITFTPNLNLATPANYELGPGDELVINLWGAADNSYNVAVDREGAIRVQNVGPVYVSGLSIEEATKKIESSLKRIYSGITAPSNSPYKIFVGISLSKVRTVQVNIIGEVKVPGTYSLSALSTVLNALYASGGPSSQGTFRDVKLVRNGQEPIYFDIYKYLLEGSQDGNKTLQDQDVLIVTPYLSRVTIEGSVKRPGIYEMKPNETFSDLLNFASGFTSNAYKGRVVLERIEGDRRIVKEIDLTTTRTTPLLDGDKLTITAIIDKFINRVEIEGAVYRPGQYEFTPELTLKELIEKAAGVQEFAFLEKGLIYRTEDGVTKSALSFSVENVLNGTENITLQPDDSVKIYDKYNLEESYNLSIDGAVNAPDTFTYIENLTVVDLVLLAGGFKDGANLSQIDVYRRVEDNQFNTLSKSIKVSVDGTIGEAANQFILQPNDRVAVRYLKGFSDQIKVSVVGEANYPGIYNVESKNELISDLLERAGGLSPYAFVEGASLIRKNPYYKDDAQSRTTEALEDKDYLSDDKTALNNQEEFRVGIDLRKILEKGGKGSKYNMILQNGDRLIIPSTKETVKVNGEILVPSLVRFDKNYNLRDYISKSGGFSSDAKKGKTYVVYSNGDIAATKSFLFFRTYPKLKPGALILVPSKPADRRKISAQEVVSIGTGITTLGLLIDRLLQ